MTWFKVDDRFTQHWKVMGLSMSALGTWLWFGTWSAQQETDGFVPERVVRRVADDFDDVQALVDAGLWERAEGGFRFHDWADYQPTAADNAARRDKEKARKRRYRKGRDGRYSAPGQDPSHRPDTPAAHEPQPPVPDGQERDDETSPADSSGVPSVSQGDRTGTDQVSPEDRTSMPNMSATPTRPDPTRPVPTTQESPDGDSSSAHDADAPVRADVKRICEHMADSVAERTGRRPTITKAWKTAARLMLDRDGREEQDIQHLIDWAANDDFWRANVLSLPKLRKQYDQLALQSQRRERRIEGIQAYTDLAAQYAQQPAQPPDLNDYTGSPF